MLAFKYSLSRYFACHTLITLHSIPSNYLVKSITMHIYNELWGNVWWPEGINTTVLHDLLHLIYSARIWIVVLFTLYLLWLFLCSSWHFVWKLVKTLQQVFSWVLGMITVIDTGCCWTNFIVVSLGTKVIKPIWLVAKKQSAFIGHCVRDFLAWNWNKIPDWLPTNICVFVCACLCDVH